MNCFRCVFDKLSSSILGICVFCVNSYLIRLLSLRFAISHFPSKQHHFTKQPRPLLLLPMLRGHLFIARSPTHSVSAASTVPLFLPVGVSGGFLGVLLGYLPTSFAARRSRKTPRSPFSLVLVPLSYIQRPKISFLHGRRGANNIAVARWRCFTVTFKSVLYGRKRLQLPTGSNNSQGKREEYLT